MVKQEFPDAKEETGILSKNSALQNNAKSAAFCSFCAFAEKNAVSLANQGCKGSKSRLPDRADEAEADAVVVGPVEGEAAVVPERDGTL